MSDGEHKGPRSVGAPAPGNVTALAKRALSQVASTTREKTLIRSVLFNAVMDTLGDTSEGAHGRTLRLFADAGVGHAAAIDIYLTEAARRLGEAWCSDEMSFAEVTIGAARIQALVRDLSTPEPLAIDAPCVLLAVPEDAYHTLGAVVLADQLRRMGVSVRLALGVTPLTLSHLIQPNDFDAILISAASSEKLETLRKLVKTVRTELVPAPPICLGGTVLDRDLDVRTLTGADHITNDIQEALRLCGLTIKAPVAAFPSGGA